MAFRNLLLVALALSSASALPSPRNPEVKPELTIKFAAGFDVTIEENKPTMERLPVTETCNTGVWVIYTGYGYTFDENDGPGMIKVLQENGCRNPVLTEIGSARIAGSQSDNSLPSVTVYGEKSFQGQDLTFMEDVPDISVKVSAIISINTEVELFQLANYQGESICIREANHDSCRSGVCYTAFWGAEFPWDLTFAKSAKIGCSSSAQRF